MPFLQANGVRHHYDLHPGTAGGTPLALVAGMGGAASFWAPQQHALRSLGPLLSYDQRGTGASERTLVGSIEQLSDDFVALLDGLRIEAVHFVGHSTGGAIGMSVASRHPGRVRSLVLYASVHRADDYRRRVWGHRKRVLQELGPLAYAQTTSLFFYPPEYIAEHSQALETAEARAAEHELGSPEVMASRIDAILRFDIAKGLGHLRLPTLVTCSRDDLLTPAYFSREIASLIPQARLHVVDSGGHAFSRSRPELFNEIVTSFVAAQSRPETSAP